MRPKQPLPGRYIPPAIKGERDSEVGRRIEKGQPADPMAQRRHLAQKMRDAKLKDEIEDLERADKQETDQEIKQLRKFLQEVAEEERKRQSEMRKRVEEIVKEKLSPRPAQDSRFGGAGEEIPELVEPPAKAKRGSFMTRLKKKGKGAMAEARGAITKGGG